MGTQISTTLSMLDLVAVREGSSVSDALAIALRTAKHAESLGFKRFWVAEHHHMLSAKLAAQRGLPFAFASHFAPRYLSQLIATELAHAH